MLRRLRGGEIIEADPILFGIGHCQWPMLAVTISPPSTPRKHDAFLGRYIAKLGALVVELHFESRKRLTFTILDGGGLTKLGYRETVDTTTSSVRTCSSPRGRSAPEER